MSTASVGTDGAAGSQQMLLKYLVSKPIVAGTVAGLAERYLREHRGIHLKKWPASFRFHPAIRSSINDTVKPASKSLNKADKVQMYIMALLPQLPIGFAVDDAIFL